LLATNERVMVRMKLSRIVLVCLVLCVLGTGAALGQGRNPGGVAPLGSLPPGYWTANPDPSFCQHRQIVYGVQPNEINELITIWVSDYDTRHPTPGNPSTTIDLGWNAHIDSIQGGGSASLFFHGEATRDTWNVIYTAPSSFPGGVLDATVTMEMTDDWPPSYPQTSATDDPDTVYAEYTGP
jgi:hypothetical protein